MIAVILESIPCIASIRFHLLLSIIGQSTLLESDSLGAKLVTAVTLGCHDFVDTCLRLRGQVLLSSMSFFTRSRGCGAEPPLFPLPCCSSNISGLT